MDDNDLPVYPIKFRSCEPDPEPREDFWDDDLRPSTVEVAQTSASLITKRADLLDRLSGT